MKPLFLILCLMLPLRLLADEPLQPVPKTERKPDAPAINEPLPANERPGGRIPLKPPFVIGAWYQPRNSLTVWKSRGINTLVGYESEGKSVSLEDWQAAAELNDLFMIRQRGSDTKADLDDPYLLAWLLDDEPDIHNQEPRIVENDYAKAKRDAPKMPVFLNVSGGNVLFKKTPRVTYEQYFKSADWIGNDFYPITGWNQPTWIPRLGQAIDQCREISKGKPQFAFIEGASQKLPWLPPDSRGVTAPEFRAEIWEAVIHGVHGIVYFPQQMYPFKFDAMPSRVSGEMLVQNQLLDSIGAALVTTPNPRELNVSVNAPLEATWRKADGKLYAIVLNLSNEKQLAQPLRFTGFGAGKADDLTQDNRTVNITENGLVDDFGPYDVHVYVMKVKP